MKFKIDENLPLELGALFAAHGHEAATVHEEKLSGACDADIYDVCTIEQRVLITLDWDFSDIRAYPPRESAGIIVLALPRQDKPYVLSAALRLLAHLEKEEPAQQLWIVEPKRIRIRD